MTLEQLIYFCEIYRQRSINSASKTLNISQQSLSKSLHNLEQECNAVFFTRSKTGVAPTYLGNRFYLVAQECITKIQSFKDEAVSSQTTHIFRIACINAFQGAIPQLYSLLSTNFQNTIFDISSLPVNIINEIVQSEDNHFDIIISMLPARQIDFLSTVINRYRVRISSNSQFLRLWMNKNHPLSNYKMITEKQLQLCKFCYPKYLSYTNDTVKMFFSPYIMAEENIYFAQTPEILTDFLRRYNYVTTDIFCNNYPMTYNNFIDQPALMSKPISSNISEIKFFILENTTSNAFSVLIHSFFEKNYDF